MKWSSQCHVMCFASLFWRWKIMHASIDSKTNIFTKDFLKKYFIKIFKRFVPAIGWCLFLCHIQFHAPTKYRELFSKGVPHLHIKCIPINYHRFFFRMCFVIASKNFVILKEWLSHCCIHTCFIQYLNVFYLKIPFI